MEVDEFRLHIMKVFLSHLVVNDVVVASRLIRLVTKLTLALTWLMNVGRAVSCLLAS